MDKAIADKLAAAQNMDWTQVALNCIGGVLLGPPCFALPAGEQEFCGRARDWAGHETYAEHPGGCAHTFVPLHDMLGDLADDERRACALVAVDSGFVDGPEGTIEGQIARAIRARGSR